MGIYDNPSKTTMNPMKKLPALRRGLFPLLAVASLFGTAAHAQNLLATANPSFEDNDGYFNAAAPPEGVSQWYSTRNNDWFWVLGAGADGTPRTGTRMARLSNSSLSTLAASRPVATPGQAYTFKIWVNDLATWGQNTGRIRLQFYNNATAYIPLTLGEFNQTISPPDYNTTPPNFGFEEYSVTGFAPPGTTHVGVTVESFGYALHVDDASLVADNSVTAAAVLVSENLSFTGGKIVVGDVGSAQINAAGTFVFQLQGSPIIPTIAKVGPLTTVTFSSPIVDNVTYDYILRVPMVGGGTQEFTGSLRSFYIPQVLPGIAGAVGSWGIREYSADGSNLAGSAAVAKAGTVPFIEATRPVFNATDLSTINVRNLGNFNNDIAVVSDAPDDQNWVVVGKTVVNVPAAGTYTFSVHSDDGFAMRVSGAGSGRFLTTHGGGAVDLVDNQTIFNDQATSDAGIRGVYQFDAPGNYNITYLGWNGGGPGHYEVAWALGTFTFERETTTWSLVGNPNSPLVTAQPFRQPYQATLPGPAGSNSGFGVRSYLNVTPMGNLNDAMDFLATTTRTPNGIDTFDSVETSINHYDPDNGGTGVLPGDLPFPGNVGGTDDDNVVTVHKGRVRVATAGIYTILCNGDDGFFFRIKGVNGNPNPAFLVASQADNSVDGRFTMSNRNELFFQGGTGGASTRGVINLAAGDYDLEFVHFELSGGFFYELGIGGGSFLHGTTPPDGFFLVGAAPEGLALVTIPSANFTVSAFTTTGRPVTSASLTYPSQAGSNYRIEASINLVNWTVVASGISGQAVSTSSIVNIAALPAFSGQPRVFFRVSKE